MNLKGVFKVRGGNYMVDRSIIIQNLKEKKLLTWEEMQYLDQNPLTDLEAFSMVEDNPEKIAEYKKYYDLREAVKDGTLNEQQLKGLIDTLFDGQNQDEYFNPNTFYESLKTKLPNQYNLTQQEIHNPRAEARQRYQQHFANQPTINQTNEGLRMANKMTTAFGEPELTMNTNFGL